MNQKLTEKLSSLPDNLTAAATPADMSTAIVETERLVLKSNLEDTSPGPVIAQDYLVGEANTRGLSWKLNLLRKVADANFCKLVRIGVHGGTTRLLGTQENIDTTLSIYDALVAAYTAKSAAAFTEFIDGNKTEEGAPSVHKAGWINQWLIDAPNAIFEAVSESRETDAGNNKKLADMIAERTSAVTEFQASLAPVKPPKAERAPKTPKPPKGSKAKNNGSSAGETDSENEELVNIPAPEEIEALA